MDPLKRRGPKRLPSPLITCLDALAAEKDLALALLVGSGSKAYGMEIEGSDDDLMGVFVPRLKDLVSIHGLDRESYTGNAPDFTIHEIGKFCQLALKGNPAILETLWNPKVIDCDEWGSALIERRRTFLHRGSLKVYLAYAEAQLKKLIKGKRLHSKGGTYNSKYGAHLIRLIHAGIELGVSGEVMVRVPPDLARSLLQIRREEIPMAAVLEMARPLLERLKSLIARNALPEKPDHEGINDLVVRARLSRGD